MSHASCTSGFSSLERFEFLGDSILDHLVVRNFQLQKDELSHVEMHLLRAALVNADLLAFLCMEWAVEQERIDITELELTFTQRTTTVKLPLWRFMRHEAPRIGVVQVETAKRYASLRDEINTAIESGPSYPWALLARLQAMKFYSVGQSQPWIPIPMWFPSTGRILTRVAGYGRKLDWCCMD